MARQLENADKYEEALALFRQLWDGNRSNMAYYNGVKNNLLRAGRFDEAIDAANIMIQTSSNYSFQADVAEIYFKAADKEKAIAVWNAMLRQHADDRHVYTVVANSMIGSNLIQEAIEVYKKGREKFIDQSYFLMELADLYSIGFDYQEATLTYLDLLERENDKYAYVENRLLRLGQQIEEFNPIINVLNRELSKHKDTIYIHKLLASLYIRSSNYALAFKTYDYIDEFSSKHGEGIDEETRHALLNFAKFALHDEQYDYAIKAYDLYLSKHSQREDKIDVYMGLAESYAMRKEFMKAVEHYSMIVNADADHFMAQTATLNIGNIYLDDLHNYGLAREYFDKIIKRVPRSPLYYKASFHRGECELKENNIEEGRKWFKNIIDSRGSSDELKERSLYQLARISLWMGNFDDAMKTLGTLAEGPTSSRIGDRRGFWVNDALNLLFLIEENRKEEEALHEYAIADLLIYQHQLVQSLGRLTQLAGDYGDTEICDDILVKLGELQYTMSRYDDALRTFRTLLEDIPESRYCDEAQYYIAQIHFPHLNDEESAIKAYEMLLVNHPQSLYVEEARRKIRDIQAHRKD
ncbi:tetratricopeptide repeat protein [candidate division KSB1 bacterium]|nr:tetratricopeptide repeat protein [candidate division KSB1 bacterium]